MTLPTLTVSPLGDGPPVEPDAVVREEDTWLVLSRRPEIVEPTDEEAAELLREAADYEPRAPGSVVVRPGRPAELLAVVHDLAREPSCRPEWVDRALAEVMRELHALGARSVALPVLGAVHGSLPVLRFRRGLRDAFDACTPWALREVHLLAPPGADPRALRDVERLWPGG